MGSTYLLILKIYNPQIENMKKITLLYIIIATLLLTPVVFAAGNAIFATSETEQMGIGTSDAKAKLDVRGKLMSTKFCFGSSCKSSF